MTYHGARARYSADETKRVFAVSKIRLNSLRQITHVLWNEIGPKSNLNVSSEFVVPVANVVDAIHEGSQVSAVFPEEFGDLPMQQFAVIKLNDGSETLALTSINGSQSPTAVGLQYLPVLNEERQPTGSYAVNTFAVSKVRLDKDGRITDVYWGRVNTLTNSFATREAVSPVEDVVRALKVGDQVFALFPSENGHLPDRQFVSANYDDGRQTIVLRGKAAYDREIHDMDRLS